jgi:hypothetical protein
MKKPSLRQTARILGISAAYMSLLTRGKREWPQKLKQRYDEFVNIIDERTEEAATENINIERVTKNGGAAGTRTPYLFNAIEALSQMSYSPTRRWPWEVGCREALCQKSTSPAVNRGNQNSAVRLINRRLTA